MSPSYVARMKKLISRKMTFRNEKVKKGKSPSRKMTFQIEKLKKGQGPMEIIDEEKNQHNEKNRTLKDFNEKNDSHFGGNIEGSVQSTYISKRHFKKDKKKKKDKKYSDE